MNARRPQTEPQGQLRTFKYCLSRGFNPWQLAVTCHHVALVPILTLQLIFQQPKAPRSPDPALAQTCAPNNSTDGYALGVPADTQGLCEMKGSAASHAAWKGAKSVIGASLPSPRTTGARNFALYVTGKMWRSMGRLARLVARGSGPDCNCLDFCTGSPIEPFLAMSSS